MIGIFLFYIVEKGTVFHEAGRMKYDHTIYKYNYS